MIRVLLIVIVVALIIFVVRALRQKRVRPTDQLPPAGTQEYQSREQVERERDPLERDRHRDDE